MKAELIAKLTARAKELSFAENLPEQIENFILKKIFMPDEDKFIFFIYDNEDEHSSITAYFHEETSEFKIRQKIGLTEFCLTDFFTEELSHFQKLLDLKLTELLKYLGNIRNRKINRFLCEKNIDMWTFGLELPENIENFKIFIRPSSPVEITNGSYIIIDYSDFEIKSGIMIYYNIYNDEFSGEIYINGAPHVTYLFDAKTLDELTDKLDTNLNAELAKIRAGS